MIGSDSPPRRRSAGFFWGFVSQGASSVTNFGLTLLAGRFVGAAGLGAIFLGFSVYLATAGFQRALITEPLVARFTAVSEDERRQTARMALTAGLGWSVLATAIVASLGLVLPSPLGHGLLLFIPWLVPALVQDLWRSMLFREGRGRASAANDLSWAVVMGATLPLAWALHAEWAVVACWGAGAVAGAMLGFAQTGLRPSTVRESWAWWRREAWPLGRWLSASLAVYSVGSQLVVFLLAVVLSTRALGGLRAGMSVFAPLSLIGPALALPGLPFLARRVAHDPRRGTRAAAALGAAGAAAGAAYLTVMGLTDGRVLTLVLGQSFRPFTGLVWPLGVGQLITIASLAFGLLLRVQSRGRAFFLARLVGSACTLGLGLVLAAQAGTTGAAWGMTLGTALGSLTMVAFALRPIRRSEPSIPGDVDAEGKSATSGKAAVAPK